MFVFTKTEFKYSVTDFVPKQLILKYIEFQLKILIKLAYYFKLITFQAEFA